MDLGRDGKASWHEGTRSRPVEKQERRDKDTDEGDE